MKRTDQPTSEPTPAQPQPDTAPQPNTVVDEPATVEACAADYQQRVDDTPGGHFTATPHTQHRRD